MQDNKVNHPSHYAEGRKYEPIDVIDDWDLDFSLGNAVKYISRAGRKEPDRDQQGFITKTIEDLEKSIWYINHKIDKLKELREAPF